MVDIKGNTLPHPRRIQAKGDSVWIDSLLPGKYYMLTFMAFDCFGDSISSTIFFYTQNFFPEGMVYFPREPQYGIHHPFWIDTTEYADTNRIPVIVGEFSVNRFFRELNGVTVKDPPVSIGYRLPSLQEWMRAYKDPESLTTYYWGESTKHEEVSKYAWYNMNADSNTWVEPHAENAGIQKVAQLLPN